MCYLITQGTGSAVTKGTFTILCSCDQKRVVEVYCEKHDQVICPSCKTIKHRNCKICPIKDKVDKHTKKQFNDLMVKAKSLKAEIESHSKQDGEANRKKLDNYTEECKKEIADFRRDINKILDKIYKEILEKLDTNANQQLQAIEKKIADMTASLQALNADLATIENANKTNGDDILFSTNIKLSKNLTKYEELIQDIRNNVQLPKLKFQKNKKIVDMLKSGGLGRIEAGSAKKGHVEILDMKVKSTKGVNIKLPNDDECPYISGCTFLSNGSILLCDYANYKMKLLDRDMSVKKCLELSEAPNNVAAVGESEAIIIFNDWNINHLQYIHIRPDLKLGKTIVLPDKCHGLQVNNDEIYCAPSFTRILDMVESGD